MNSLAVLLHPTWNVNQPFVQHIYCIRSLPISQLVAVLVVKSTVTVIWYCVQVAIILVSNGPKVQK